MVVRVDRLKDTLKELSEAIQLLLVVDIYHADTYGSGSINIQIRLQTIKPVAEVDIVAWKSLHVGDAAVYAITCPEHKRSISLIREPIRNLTDKIVLLEV
jgi:hypothetical protein